PRQRQHVRHLRHDLLGQHEDIVGWFYLLVLLAARLGLHPLLRCRRRWPPRRRDLRARVPPAHRLGRGCLASALRDALGRDSGRVHRLGALRRLASAELSARRRWVRRQRDLCAAESDSRLFRSGDDEHGEDAVPDKPDLCL
ncbi:unnamed protein product, partial [Prorocentrum cordatum]